jgi:hypothetical protein
MAACFGPIMYQGAHRRPSPLHHALPPAIWVLCLVSSASRTSALGLPLFGAALRQGLARSCSASSRGASAATPFQLLVYL